MELHLKTVSNENELLHLFEGVWNPHLWDAELKG